MKLLILFILITSLIGCEKRSFDEGEYIRKINNQNDTKFYEKNFDGKQYFNPWMKSTKSFKDVLRWKFTPAREYEIEDTEYLPERLEVDISKLEGKEDYIIWLGHMSYLINIEDEFYLLDPVFSKRALIPSRYIEPPMTMDDIYKLVGKRGLTILITHNHYDHLDKGTIKQLRKKTKILAPLGDKELIESLGEFEVVAMDWWDKNEKITFIPAQHWSNRIGKKRNTSLWGSFILEGDKTTVFLGGDSGYFKGFQEIGKKYSIDYAIVSVGAYEPRWFMHESHLDVAESIKVIDDMKVANKMIPGHWGTFKLGDEPPGYPKYEYNKIDDDRVAILDIGEIFYLEK